MSAARAGTTASKVESETFTRARTATKKDNGNDDDGEDHFTLASSLVSQITADAGCRPVYDLGAFWSFADGLWSPQTLDALGVHVGSLYGGRKYCRRGSDFRSIAHIVAELCATDRFFDEAPVGIAAGDRFWRVESAKIVTEPLAAEHRQRMRITAEPDFDVDAPLFTRLLDHAFPDDIAQRDLLQILFGAALSRCLWRHRIAALLLGKTTTGRTTLLNLLARMFPNDLVAATSPQKWGNEYYRAALAGKALNIVGELDANEPIPGGAFKSVVGCDVIEGRHPTHRPFSFVSTASQFFNANRLPPTLDRSDAFFRRWRILEFNNVVRDSEIIEGLADRIAADELPAVLAWMLEGVVMLQSVGSIPETEQHKRLIGKWRAANNSALMFLLDPTACELDPSAETPGDELFDHYKKWSLANGVRPFGRNGFYEAIDEGAGRFAVYRADRRTGVEIIGARRVCHI